MNHQEQKSTETVLIVNPNSCGGSTGKNWESLYNQINDIFGENPEVALSQKSGDGFYYHFYHIYKLLLLSLQRFFMRNVEPI
jgi:hypothetical protein